MVGVDVRPATGELYGLSNQNNLYRINMATGVSTQVGVTLATPPAGSCPRPRPRRPSCSPSSPARAARAA